MNEKTFDTVVDKLKKQRDREHAASACGVDLFGFTDNYHTAIHALLEDIFGKDKVDVLDWYLYEYRKGKMQITDNKTRKVLYNMGKEGDLWKYMSEK